MFHSVNLGLGVLYALCTVVLLYNFSSDPKGHTKLITCMRDK